MEQTDAHNEAKGRFSRLCEGAYEGSEKPLNNTKSCSFPQAFSEHLFVIHKEVLKCTLPKYRLSRQMCFAFRWMPKPTKSF